MPLRRQSRKGATLIEVMVTIALLVVVSGIMLFSMDRLFGLQQSRAARQLGVNYELLHDQAILHNATFRFAFHLDSDKYTIEVGDGETLIFSDPDARATWERELEDRRRMYTDEELAAEEEASTRFTRLASALDTEVELPRNTIIARVYTPQYGEWVEPGDNEDEPTVVYSYIFPNGFAEPTVVQLTSPGEEDDEDNGYTIWVESLSGRVHIRTGLVHWRETMGDLPDQGPDLP